MIPPSAYTAWGKAPEIRIAEEDRRISGGAVGGIFGVKGKDTEGREKTTDSDLGGEGGLSGGVKKGDSTVRRRGCVGGTPILLRHNTVCPFLVEEAFVGKGGGSGGDRAESPRPKPHRNAILCRRDGA